MRQSNASSTGLITLVHVADHTILQGIINQVELGQQDHELNKVYENFYAYFDLKNVPEQHKKHGVDLIFREQAWKNFCASLNKVRQSQFSSAVQTLASHRPKNDMQTTESSLSLHWVFTPTTDLKPSLWQRQREREPKRENERWQERMRRERGERKRKNREGSYPSRR